MSATLHVVPAGGGVLGLVPLFHPDERAAAALRALAPQVDRLVVVDDTPGERGSGLSPEGVFAGMPPRALRWIGLGENRGLAHALARGLAEAESAGLAWMIAFDQDSEVRPDHVRRLLDAAERWRGRPAAIVAPALPGDRGGRGLSEVPRAITSGALTRAAALRAAGGFREDLFIDYVDFEACLRLRARGWAVVRDGDLVLGHRIGAPAARRLLGRPVVTTNHAPVRRYYKLRNRVAVVREHFGEAPLWLGKEVLSTAWEAAKIALLEEDRAAKLGMMARGLADGLRGKMGRYAPGGGIEDGGAPRATDGGAPRATNGGAPRATDGTAPRATDGGAPRATDGTAPRATDPGPSPSPPPPRVSVCVATFDGMPWVEEQLATILPQLGPDDELVVSDNGSTDGTREHLAALRDPRLRLLDFTARRGPVPNFEHALRHATREVIVLADQDDVWLPGRLERVRATFAGAGDDLLCAVADGERIDGEGRLLARENLALLGFAPGLVRNLVRNRFMGCTMAFRRTLLDVALPFPPGIPMHDAWLGILAGALGRVTVVPGASYRYRLHGRNASQRRRPLRAKLGGRAALAAALAARLASPPARRLRAVLREGRT